MRVWRVGASSPALGTPRSLLQVHRIMFSPLVSKMCGCFSGQKPHCVEGERRLRVQGCLFSNRGAPWLVRGPWVRPRFHQLASESVTAFTRETVSRLHV